MDPMIAMENYSNGLLIFFVQNVLDPQRAGNPDVFFFRPTPLGFRQVVQHVRLHVA